MASLKELSDRVTKTIGDIASLKAKAASDKYTAGQIYATAEKQMVWLNSKGGKWKSKNQNEYANVKSDSDTKFEQASTLIAAANKILDIEIPQLQKILTAQESAVAEFNTSSADVARELSKQGLTYEGSTRKSTLEGEGEKQARLDLAKAEAAAIALKATVDTDNKKNMGYIALAGGALAVVIIAVVLFKKIKNK